MWRSSLPGICRGGGGSRGCRFGGTSRKPALGRSGGCRPGTPETSARRWRARWRQFFSFDGGKAGSTTGPSSTPRLLRSGPCAVKSVVQHGKQGVSDGQFLPGVEGDQRDLLADG